MNVDRDSSVEVFREALGVRRVLASLSHHERLDQKRCGDAPHSQSPSCKSWQILLQEDDEW